MDTVKLKIPLRCNDSPLCGKQETRQQTRRSLGNGINLLPYLTLYDEMYYVMALRKSWGNILGKFTLI